MNLRHSCGMFFTASAKKERRRALSMVVNSGIWGEHRQAVAELDRAERSLTHFQHRRGIDIGGQFHAGSVAKGRKPVFRQPVHARQQREHDRGGFLEIPYRAVEPFEIGVAPAAHGKFFARDNAHLILPGGILGLRFPRPIAVRQPPSANLPSGARSEARREPHGGRGCPLQQFGGGLVVEITGAAAMGAFTIAGLYIAALQRIGFAPVQRATRSLHDGFAIVLDGDRPAPLRHRHGR